MIPTSPPKGAFVQRLSTAATTLPLTVGAVVLPIGPHRRRRPSARPAGPADRCT